MITTVRTLLQGGSISLSWNTLDPHGKDKKMKLAQQRFFLKKCSFSVAMDMDMDMDIVQHNICTDV